MTRWESILGRWPGIVLASLVWAAWHVGIQDTGRLGTAMRRSRTHRSAPRPLGDEHPDTVNTLNQSLHL
ncbi:hypothetical protein [Micromonospora sp. RTGN7]|uniref:hypothetical protein n=1 Tax=Micromonospora sp. RTGN7 TaxID=3016526 RepID=UPI0029FECFAA|nr:hypothetical protein [Micromonospora sp. RTGN7]